MYNLAHIYLYEIQTDEKIDKSIELLLESTKQNFEPSKYLLCIALIKKYEFDIAKIQNEFIKRSCSNLIEPIIQLILDLQLNNKSIFQSFEKKYMAIDYLYNCFNMPVLSKNVLNAKNEQNNGILKPITQDFRDGFGNDI